LVNILKYSFGKPVLVTVNDEKIQMSRFQGVVEALKISP